MRRWVIMCLGYRDVTMLRACVVRGEKNRFLFSVLKFWSEWSFLTSDFCSEILSLPDWKGGQEGLRYPCENFSTAIRQLLFGECQPEGDNWWGGALTDITSVYAVLVSIRVRRQSEVKASPCWPSAGRLLILESDWDDLSRTSSFDVDVSVSENIICFVGPASQRFLML
jgi:hypothetical protein